MSRYVFAGLWVILAPTCFAETIGQAVKNGRAYVEFNLRLETVSQDNSLKDATALTLRSRVGFATGKVSGFSGLIEFEDSRPVVGIDDYNDALGSRLAYSVIADPKTTELDQTYFQYNLPDVVAKLGRQVITYDDHRFVGDVGWRQDRQTFDAFSLGYDSQDLITANYNFVTQRNRIFAEEKDIDSRDHLLNLKYEFKTAKLVGYAYLLEEDNDSKLSHDTYGIRLAGGVNRGEGFRFSYAVEVATQQKQETLLGDYRASFYRLEAGIQLSQVNVKFNFERLGSDDGNYGFATPLATLHKFNGWADLFLTTPDVGLDDIALGINGALAGGKWVITYHDFSSDEGNTDLGQELNAQYVRAFAPNYAIGLKYANYRAADVNVDTQRAWLWFSAKF